MGAYTAYVTERKRKLDKVLRCIYAVLYSAIGFGNPKPLIYTIHPTHVRVEVLLTDGIPYRRLRVDLRLAHRQPAGTTSQIQVERPASTCRMPP